MFAPLFAPLGSACHASWLVSASYSVLLFAQNAPGKAKEVGDNAGAQAANWWGQYGLLLLGGIGILFFLVFIFIFFNFVQLWIQAYLAGAKVGFLDMIRMKLLKIDYAQMVKQNIALAKAGLKVPTQDLEAHWLAKGNVTQVVNAVIAAHKAGMDLPWRTAAAIQLAGRNVEEAVNINVRTEVISCPDVEKGKQYLEGVCRNGIQLKARALVTVRTKLDRLVGGAWKATVVARVGEGIVKAIGSADHHTDVLANPNLISKAVLENSLDAQTAFEIVSIDIAEIDVGENIGAQLQVRQAEADLQVARANAEKRAALARAQEQEMRARVEENRAQVVLSEADVPRAIADAFRNGRLGVMEYYQLKNLQSDTQMRTAIAGVGGTNDRTDRTGG
jgi:uncharacterized protein YqfA (UPF0365 family)